MLGGFALMPLIPDAPVGVRMFVVIIGLGLFTVGLYAVRVWIVDQAQQDNDKRRRTK
jgi:phage shock protein PspC (stress-responsive transcriptional regulator)